MPLNLDPIDVKILKALVQDGRLSFRKIAGMTGVSTPTVEDRYRKMISMGLIKRVSALIDLSKVSDAVSAFVMMRARQKDIDDVLKTLESFEEVQSVFLTAGEANIIARVFTGSSKRFQEFMNKKLMSVPVDLISTHVITGTIKEDNVIPLIDGLAVSLHCDFCGVEIAGKPFIMNYSSGKRFFCCKTCSDSYREKYKI